MKKAGIFLSVLVALVVFGWLGITFAFSNLVEPWIDAGLTKANEEQSVAVLEKTEFEKGFFSSRTTTSITGEVITGALEDVDEILLQHEIFHGPVAMTPGGPQFCQAYVRTTLDRSNWDDKTAREVEKAFGETEPVTIETWRSYGGEEKVIATVSGFSCDHKEATAEFGGAVFRVEGSSQEERAEADFQVSALEVNPKEETGGMRMKPSSGNLSFQKGSHLSGAMSFGAANLAFEDDGSEGGSIIELDGGSLNLDLKALDAESDLLLGTMNLTFPGATMKSTDYSGKVGEIALRSDTSEESGELKGTITYSIGSLDSTELTAAVGGADLSFLYPAALSLSYSGVNTEGAVKLSENMEKMQAELAKGGGEEAEIDPAILDELVDGIFEVASPGLGVGVSLALGQQEETPNVRVDLSADMKGQKKLREMKTWREVLDAMVVKLQAATSDSVADNQIIMPYLMQAQMMGIGKRSLGGAVQAEAKVENVQLMIDGKPSPLPLLQAIEPMLNQPIDWDTFIQGMKQGLKASAAASVADDGAAADAAAADANEEIK
jgi:uncharacterized protein YdgA (DUF945 family)